MAGVVGPFTGLEGQASAPGTVIPDDYQRIQASPEAFGAQIGQAESGALSQGVQDVGVAATQIQALHDKISADAATNQNMMNGRNLLYGDPNDPNSKGFFALQGADALHALPQVSQQLEQQRAAISATLTPQAQLLFDQDSRRYNTMLQDQIGSHGIQQQNEWAKQTAQSGVTLHMDDAAKNVANPNVWNASVGSALQLQASEDARLGVDPSTAQLHQQALTSRAWSDRIDQASSADPSGAQQLLEQNKGSLTPQDYEQLSQHLLVRNRSANVASSAAGTIGGFDDGYSQSIAGRVAAPGSGVAITPAQMGAAITGQESGGNPSAPTSVDGAVGQFQIMPATFAQYARPGEAIQSAADQKTVFNRIMTDLSAKYPNDPQRQAVAYFSGTGNVSPTGSVQPFLQDRQDGTGKSTSSYVSDVMTRLGSAGGVAGIPSRADYYRANAPAIVEKAAGDYLASHPGDEQGAQQAQSRAEAQIRQVISTQEMAYKADNDTVLTALNGNLSTGQHPTTIEQLTADPNVAGAWNRMQTQQPEAAHQIATRLLTENARQSPADVKTLGSGFDGVFQRIHAAPDDPNRITDQAQLYSMVGQPNGLTMEGLARARTEISGRNTPDGEAEAAMRGQMFKTAHGEISGANDLLGKDPQGEALFSRFQAQAYAAIDAGKKQGLTAQQLYDPASPNYVGKTIPSFKRSEAQKTADLVSANSTEAAPSAPASGRMLGGMFGGSKPDLSSPISVRQAYGSGSISRADALKALRGFDLPKPPAPLKMAQQDGPTVPTGN